MAMPAEIMTCNSFVPDPSNQRAYRSALGCFGTGVTIVTAASDAGPVAITVNSFASVSLTPPLVLWSLDRHGSRYDMFSRVETYSIHVLNRDQEALCMEVAKNSRRLIDEALPVNHLGVPILRHCAARFDCTREVNHVAGDHVIIVGRVRLATQYEMSEPLAFYRGSTGTFAMHRTDAA